ncbi:hypothetical protein ACFL11_00450 [Patescibacteria group bacterium]
MGGIKDFVEKARRDKEAEENKKKKLRARARTQTERELQRLTSEIAKLLRPYLQTVKVSGCIGYLGELRRLYGLTHTRKKEENFYYQPFKGSSWDFVLVGPTRIAFLGVEVKLVSSYNFPFIEITHDLSDASIERGIRSYLLRELNWRQKKRPEQKLEVPKRIEYVRISLTWDSYGYRRPNYWGVDRYITGDHVIQFMFKYTNRTWKLCFSGKELFPKDWKEVIIKRLIAGSFEESMSGERKNREEHHKSFLRWLFGR